jgi:hypothetical protein
MTTPSVAAAAAAVMLQLNASVISPQTHLPTD